MNLRLNTDREWINFPELGKDIRSDLFRISSDKLDKPIINRINNSIKVIQVKDKSIKMAFSCYHSGYPLMMDNSILCQLANCYEQLNDLTISLIDCNGYKLAIIELSEVKSAKYEPNLITIECTVNVYKRI